RQPSAPPLRGRPGSPPRDRRGLHVRPALRRSRVDRLRGRAAAPHGGSPSVFDGGAGALHPPVPAGALPGAGAPPDPPRPTRHTARPPSRHPDRGRRRRGGAGAGRVGSQGPGGAPPAAGPARSPSAVDRTRPPAPEAEERPVLARVDPPRTAGGRLPRHVAGGPVVGCDRRRGRGLLAPVGPPPRPGAAGDGTRVRLVPGGVEHLLPHA